MDLNWLRCGLKHKMLYTVIKLVSVYFILERVTVSRQMYGFYYSGLKTLIENIYAAHISVCRYQFIIGII